MVRSPRSQREACNRLAAPRPPPAPAAHAPTVASDTFSSYSSSAAGQEHKSGSSTDARSGAVASAEEQAENLVVIPSLLSQCSGQLQRIDEDRPAALPTELAGAGVSARRGRERASSVPAGSAGAAYAVPVVPGAKASSGVSTSSASSGSISSNSIGGRRLPRSRSANRAHDAHAARGRCTRVHAGSAPSADGDDLDWAAWAAELEAADATSTEEDGEAVLATIDRLYSALLANGKKSGDDAADLAALLSKGNCLADNVAVRAQEAPAAERPTVAGEAATGNGGMEGEALLASIDQLYNDVLVGGCSGGGRDGGGVEEEAKAEEMQWLLSEVLWDALLLARNAEGRIDVQARLFELLPPTALAQCVATCGSRQGLPPSLAQRLAVELPGICAALDYAPTPDAGGGSGDTAALTQTLRKARDNLLVLTSASAVSVAPAADSDEGALEEGSATASDCGALTMPPLPQAKGDGTTVPAKKQKPRRTSLSHWTRESVDALEAPPRRISQRLPRPPVLVPAPAAGPGERLRLG